MRSQRRQIRPDEDGAVIVEFAAIFVLFATLLAGLITYGMIFAVQQSLSHASSEAARSVVGVTDAGEAESRIDSVLDAQLDWLGGLDAVEHDVSGWSCSDDPCLVDISVSYDGQLIELFPFRIATPDRLSAHAVLQHDVEVTP